MPSQIDSRFGRPVLLMAAAILILLSAVLSVSSSRAASAASGTVHLPVVLNPGEPEPATRPSGNLADLIERNVEDGVWTLEEGLIHVLGYMADEKTADELPNLDTVARLEATSVMRMADEYRQNGADPQARAEIERLFFLQLPPQANVDFYSVENGAARAVWAAGSGGTRCLSHQPCLRGRLAKRPAA